ncbi:MAG: hypothetical protein ACTSSP_04585 [Candidatus Asgardarchaeia archaeon]
MSEYDISLFSSAVRPDMWKKIYKSFMKNKVSIELVFVGDKYPSYKLPLNFKFIYSEVKPSQCFEIAARNCSGKYVAMVSDDCYHEDGYYDSMLAFHKKQVEKFSTDKIIVGGLHYFGRDTQRRTCRLWTGNAQPNQELPMDFFLTNELYKKMGGLDRNFISLVHHWDLMMRILEIGGKCVLSRDKFYECPDKNKDHTELSSVTGRIDKKYFHELWWCYWNKDKFIKRIGTKKYKNKVELKQSGDPFYVYNRRGYIPTNRQKEFEPFDDKDILTISQGSVFGKWDR